MGVLISSKTNEIPHTHVDPGGVGFRRCGVFAKIRRKVNSRDRVLMMDRFALPLNSYYFSNKKRIFFLFFFSEAAARVFLVLFVVIIFVQRNVKLLRSFARLYNWVVWEWAPNEIPTTHTHTEAFASCDAMADKSSASRLIYNELINCDAGPSLFHATLSLWWRQDAL